MTPSESKADMAKVIQQPSCSFEIKQDFKLNKDEAAEVDDWGAMKTPAPIGNKKFELI